MNTNTEQKTFQWTNELVREFSEYVGLRVARDKDIRQQIELLQGDFIKLKSSPPEQPKEWEIVARISTPVFRDIAYGKIIEKGDILWPFAELRNYPIHSVRRLSDGETFSVGENATYGRINGFEIREGEMGVLFHKLDPLQSLYQISKLPPPTPKEETVKVDEKSKIVSQLDMYNMGYKDAIKYTDAIILETQRKAFEAAREYNTNPNTFYPKPIFEPRLTYPTFADYIQSLKK